MVIEWHETGIQSTITYKLENIFLPKKINLDTAEFCFWSSFLYRILLIDIVNVSMKRIRFLLDFKTSKHIFSVDSLIRGRKYRETHRFCYHREREASRQSVDAAKQWSSTSGNFVFHRSDFRRWRRSKAPASHLPMNSIWSNESHPWSLSLWTRWHRKRIIRSIKRGNDRFRALGRTSVGRWRCADGRKSSAHHRRSPRWLISTKHVSYSKRRRKSVVFIVSERSRISSFERTGRRKSRETVIFVLTYIIIVSAKKERRSRSTDEIRKRSEERERMRVISSQTIESRKAV